MCKMTKKAKKFMKRLNRKDAKRVNAMIVKIVADPYGFEMLTTGQRKARIGKNRIVFSVIDGEVVIDNIGNRETIYNSL